jgi:tRNA(fMet)-specific endonuclease VapC
VIQYLLDTDICIHFLKRDAYVRSKLSEIGISACAISELTLLELLYGVEGSAPGRMASNRAVYEDFAASFLNRTYPIREAFTEFARQKVTLRRTGRTVADFDLLIGCTALNRNLSLATRNLRHFRPIDGLRIAEWSSNT